MKLACIGVLAVALLAGAGCANLTTEDGRPRIGDPIRGFNEAMFTVNDKLHLWVVEPVGTGWASVIPKNARLRVRDFFNNLDMPRRMLNAFLQGDLRGGGVELARFGINTTVGVLGLWDFATRWDFLQRDEDFGQTFAVWGSGPGPYLVIPLVGPSSVRDGLGKVLDMACTISVVIPGASVLDRVNHVSLHLGEYEAFKDDALDPYVAMRNAWFQNRLHLIRNEAADRGDMPPVP